LTPPVDIDRLSAFIAEHITGGRCETVFVEPVAGGQSNPTYFITTDGRQLVLRSQPRGELLPSAHAIDREYRVMSALAQSDVPVPAVLCYSEDRSITGTPFYLMERVEGRVYRNAALEGVSPKERRLMYLSAAETLAKLHCVDWKGVGLGDYGRSGDYFGRQLNRWSRQWLASKTREIPEIDRLIAWLPSHVPDSDHTAIAHGDFRLGNLIFHPTEPHVAAVLDWELSTLGHPLADLGFFCIPYHTLANEYGGVMDLDAEALGIPDEREIVDHYRHAVGDDEPLRPFHVAFALFRFAVIFAGVEARAAQGNAADADAASVGWLAEAMAKRGCEAARI